MINSTRVIRQFIRLLCVAACVGILASQSATAQAPATTPAANMPHKVGLIDMAYIFKNYKKFEDRRTALKDEIAATDAEAKAMAEELKAIDQQLKQQQLKPGSPEFQALEAKGFQIKAKFDAFSSKAKRDFMLKEAAIYKEIYLEVSEAVAVYAKYYNYTLIMRFSKETVEKGDQDPRELIQGMNNQVVYHNPEFDITDRILQHLNNKYTPIARTNVPVTR